MADSDDGEVEDLLACPGVFIPCESLEALQELIYDLYDSGVLQGDETYLLRNVPDTMIEILNDPDYFLTEEICGIRLLKGEVVLLEKKTEDLL